MASFVYAKTQRKVSIQEVWVFCLMFCFVVGLLFDVEWVIVRFVHFFVK